MSLNQTNLNSSTHHQIPSTSFTSITTPTTTTPKRTFPRPSSSTSNSSPPPALRSRPSVLSFASLAPSDSRSNPHHTSSTPFAQAFKRRPDAGHTRSSQRHGLRATLDGSGPARPITEDEYTPLKRLAGRPEDLELLTIEDPDELFQAFTVREVRLLAHRARLDAAKKQEDLRQMVGERYRDLLGAADSIVRMKVSSLGLLDMLCASMDLCNKSELKRKAAEAGRQSPLPLCSPSVVKKELALH